MSVLHSNLKIILRIRVVVKTRPSFSSSFVGAAGASSTAFVVCSGTLTPTGRSHQKLPDSLNGGVILRWLKD